MRNNHAEGKLTYRSLMTGVLSVLVCLTLISLWMLGNLYARYTTQGEGSDSATVAVFSITDSNTLTKDFAVSLNGVDSQQIQVQIINKSEVAVRYRMEFTSDGNLPLDIQAGNPSNGDTITKSTDPDTMSWTVEKPVDGNRKNPDTYVFTVKLQNADYTYSGGVEHLTLSVTAEQID